MTQIIAVISHNFITVVSDRRLSYVNPDGSFIGIKTDNECKLVALCEHSCIAYTGLAKLGGFPTHEWITRTLSNRRCIDAWHAAKILTEECEALLENKNESYRHMTFLITGYRYINKSLTPYSLRISNSYTDDDAWKTEASNSFRSKLYYLKPDEFSESVVIGIPLKRKQNRRLKRYLRKSTIERSLPQATLKFLSDEIITSSRLGNRMVGKKILGVSIPKQQIIETQRTGNVFISHHIPNNNRATFTYYDEGSDGLKIYGPSFVCGDSAISQFSGTTNDKVVSATVKII
ncbi:MAG: hypothetical protein JAZ17_14960 [Candidatus Thiodiazotropha endolucinida]|nr:hypothetical protein [Candidatus Thiodiazotropha endolucinida]